MDARLMKGSYSIGNRTASSGNAFFGIIPPHSGAYTKIVKATYTSAGSQHTLTILKAQGKTVTTAASLATTTSLSLASVSLAYGTNGANLSESLAANDWLVVQHTDGTWGGYMVSSVSGLTVALSTTASAGAAALAKDVASGAIVYAMYEVGRTVGKEHVAFSPPLSATTNFETFAPEVGIAQSWGQNEPLMLYSNNATAAGTLVSTAAIYSRV